MTLNEKQTAIRILNLLSRSAGSEDCLLVFDIHRMLARQLAYHSQRRLQRLQDVEIGQRRRDRFRIAIGPWATGEWAFVQNSHWFVLATPSPARFALVG